MFLFKNMKKPVFVLKNINKNALDLKYNIMNIQKTKIADITEKEENHFFSYLDESKKNHQCILTMKSFMNQEMLPEKTNLYCFWCRHSFPFRPIGCPIEYISPRLSKSYHSEITKDQYILRENISVSQIAQIVENKKEQNDMVEFNVIENDYYLMDGLFCSFNCCLAYIKENINNPLYIYSESLLNKIYFDVFGKSSQILIEAPSWRLLKSYGGHMSIEEYRKNFYKVDYLDVNNVIYPFPKSKCVGYLFEKQIKL